MDGGLGRTTFRFCTQCGTKLQSSFKFCPSCGEKIPCAADTFPLEAFRPSPNYSPPKGDEANTTRQSSSMRYEATDVHGSLPTPRPALRKTRNSLRLDRDAILNVKEDPPPVSQDNSVSTPKQTAVKRVKAAAPVEASPPPILKSPRSGRGRSAHLQPAEEGENLTDETIRNAEESTVDNLPLTSFSPLSAPASNSPYEDNSMSSPKQTPVKRVKKAAPVEASPPPIVKSPRSGRGRSTHLQPVEEGENLTDESRSTGESAVDSLPLTAFSPLSTPASKSPFKGRGQSKAKKVVAVERLEDGEELTDTTGRKWTLVKLLSQSVTELVYEVVHKGSRSSSKESDYILKLGAERGRIYKEQNFLQRAAKPSYVAKWIKRHELDFLGIPSCVSFGHTDSYRFLVFPAMGQSLQSFMDNNRLPEKTVLHLACRILDVLHYIHSNEYAHADVNAQNIYIQSGRTTQVYLVGYHHVSRYCPGGHHVVYRQGIQDAHEGSLEFISIDSHMGAVPSRRSDLQSLGYCMLQWHTGTLPWSGLTDPDQVAELKQRYLNDVPALLSHCFGRSQVSSAIQSYVSAVSDLQYTEQPDYSELKGRLAIALSQLGGSVKKTLSL
ncbi:serine/threonine-protein kinase VRK3 isoform X1 [Festucalex cinctus]